MAARRAGGKSTATGGGGGGGAGSGAVFNAVFMALAVVGGLAILVQRGRLDWPPNHLLASLYTVAGCLALVGPIILSRLGEGGGNLGELLWMTGGLLVWVNDVVSVLRGEWRAVPWATPLSTQTMGLTILAVLLAGWRCGINGRSWSWTNVTGWMLGLFWVTMAGVAMLPPGTFGLALR